MKIYKGKGEKTLSILVVNYNHWLGYHIVNALLENDYQVDGIQLKQGVEDLSMFFGRNSNFSIITPQEFKRYDFGIIVGDYNHDIQQNCERLFVINPEQERIRNLGNNVIHIKTDLLFGEWIPMEEKGVFFQGKLIPFTSDFFKEHAIYVEDFTKGLMQWMNITELPSTLHVHSKKTKMQADLKLEKNIYLRENVYIDENVKTVVDHYQFYRKENR